MGYKRRVNGKYRIKKKQTHKYDSVQLMIIEDIENELQEADLDNTDYGINLMMEIKEHIEDNKPNIINKWTQTVADIATKAKANNDN